MNSGLEQSLCVSDYSGLTVLVLILNTCVHLHVLQMGSAER